MLGAIIGAGASLLGGMLNRSSAEDAQRENARVQAEQAEKNRQMQLQFAQEGIRWKVDDARAAGIHPLYALGANTVSYAPVSVGQSYAGDTSLGSGVASAGQDISRAMNATRTLGERESAFQKTVQDLSLTKMGLENELLASQIQKLRAASNPPMPSISDVGPIPEANKWEERPRILLGGRSVTTDPSTVNMKEIEDRYGDDGLASWLGPAYLMWRDYVSSANANRDYQLSNPFHSERRNPARSWWLDKLREWR